MTTRRKNLLVALPVLYMLLYVGGIGEIELLVWLGLVSIWFALFVVWGRRR